jgi:hypothetical protein
VEIEDEEQMIEALFERQKLSASRPAMREQAL